MRTHLRIIRRLFSRTILFFGISALAVCFIPLTYIAVEPWATWLRDTDSIFFWIGLIVACLYCKKTGNYLKKANSYRNREYAKSVSGFPGIINFSSEKTHCILYGICGTGILLIVSDLIFHYVSPYIMFPIISIVFFTFTVHCIIDGKNYRLYQLIRDGKDNG